MKPFPIILSALHACYPRTAIVKLVLTIAISSTIDIAATIAIMVKLGNHFPTVAASCKATHLVIKH